MMANWFRLRLTGPDPIGFVAGNMVRQVGLSGVGVVEYTFVNKDRIEFATVAFRNRRDTLPVTSLILVKPDAGKAYDTRRRK